MHFFKFNLYIFKANLSICFVISIALIGPVFFSVTIWKASDSPSETQGYWTTSELTKNYFFNMYNVMMFFLESIIPLVTLIALNIVVLFKFRKVMENKRRLLGKGRRTGGAINRFTRLILALSFICIITCSIDTATVALKRYYTVHSIPQSYQYIEDLNFARRFALFLVFAEHGLDVLLYYCCDNNLRVFLSISSH